MMIRQAVSEYILNRLMNTKNIDLADLHQAAEEHAADNSRKKKEIMGSWIASGSFSEVCGAVFVFSAVIE